VQKCPSAGDLDRSSPILVNATRNWAAVLSLNRLGKPLPANLQGLQYIANVPREFRTLVFLLENPQTLRAFFRDACRTAEVAPPLRDLFGEYANLNVASRENLLICRDRGNATETYYECAAPSPLPLPNPGRH
jgi:hypothetical protein